MTEHRSQQRNASHSATEATIAPHQVIRRGMPVDRIGVDYADATRRFDVPIYAAHPHAAANQAGPHSIAASDVTTGAEPGKAMVIDHGSLFPLDQLVLPPGMTVVDGQNVGWVRVIDTFAPEPTWPSR